MPKPSGKVPGSLGAKKLGKSLGRSAGGALGLPGAEHAVQGGGEVHIQQG